MLGHERDRDSMKNESESKPLEKDSCGINGIAKERERERKQYRERKREGEIKKRKDKDPKDMVEIR